MEVLLNLFIIYLVSMFICLGYYKFSDDRYFVVPFIILPCINTLCCFIFPFAILLGNVKINIPNFGLDKESKQEIEELKKKYEQEVAVIKKKAEKRKMLNKIDLTLSDLDELKEILSERK